MPFWSLQFLPNKWTKTRRILVKTNSFVCFLEEFTAWQFAFEINWPLVNIFYLRGRSLGRMVPMISRLWMWSRMAWKKKVDDIKFSDAFFSWFSLQMFFLDFYFKCFDTNKPEIYWNSFRFLQNFFVNIFSKNCRQIRNHSYIFRSAIELLFWPPSRIYK